MTFPKGIQLQVNDQRLLVDLLVDFDQDFYQDFDQDFDQDLVCK